MTEQLRMGTLLIGFAWVDPPGVPSCGGVREFRTRTLCGMDSRCEFAEKLSFRRHLFRSDSYYGAAG